MATNARFGYALLERGAPAARPRRTRSAGRGGRLRLRDALRPLPPLDRPPGPEPVRLVGPRGIAAATDRITVGTGVTALSSGSTRRSSPRPSRRSRRCCRAVLVRRRDRENLNEHVLGDAWPEHLMRGDARGGRRPHPPACGRASSSTTPAISTVTGRGSTPCPTSRCRSSSPPAARTGEARGPDRRWADLDGS